MKYEEKILTLLVENYRKSKKDSGENKTNRRTQIKPEKLYKKYNANDGEYDEITKLDQAVDSLAARGFLTKSTERFGTQIQCIYLVDEKLPEIERYLVEKYGYVSKDMQIVKLQKLVDNYRQASPICEEECLKLEQCIKERKIPKNIDELDDVLKAVAFIEFDNAEYKEVRSTEFAPFDGRNHNVYFVFSGEGIEFDSWKFVKGEETLRPEEAISSTEIRYETMVISAQAENPGPSPTTILEMTKNGDYSVKSSTFDGKSEVLNMGYINTDPDATYKVHVNSLGFETENGMVEIPVDVELDPTSSSANGLENGWKGAAIGTVLYGTKECGIVAAETTITWIGYRLALVMNGQEVPYTSITYNITVSGLVFE